MSTTNKPDKPSPPNQSSPPAPSPGPAADDPLSFAAPLSILYRNHRGEIGRRSICPRRIYWGAEPPWHPEPGWILEAFDIDKHAVRSFAWSGIIRANPDDADEGFDPDEFGTGLLPPDEIDPDGPDPAAIPPHPDTLDPSAAGPPYLRFIRTRPDPPDSGYLVEITGYEVRSDGTAATNMTDPEALVLAAQIASEAGPSLRKLDSGVLGDLIDERDAARSEATRATARAARLQAEIDEAKQVVATVQAELAQARHVLKSLHDQHAGTLEAYERARDEAVAERRGRERAEGERDEARQELGRTLNAVGAWTCTNPECAARGQDFPGPVDDGHNCVICPRCDRATVPKAVAERDAARAEVERLKAENVRALGRNAELADRLIGLDRRLTESPAGRLRRLAAWLGGIGRRYGNNGTNQETQS